MQLIECPSIYELMANPNFPWDCHPLLQIWRETHDVGLSNGTLLESYELTEAVPLMKEALINNMVSHNIYLFVNFSRYYVCMFII